MNIVLLALIFLVMYIVHNMFFYKPLISVADPIVTDSDFDF